MRRQPAERTLPRLQYLKLPRQVVEEVASSVQPVLSVSPPTSQAIRVGRLLRSARYPSRRAYLYTASQHRHLLPLSEAPAEELRHVEACSRGSTPVRSVPHAVRVRCQPFVKARMPPALQGPPVSPFVRPPVGRSGSSAA